MSDRRSVLHTDLHAGGIRRRETHSYETDYEISVGLDQRCVALGVGRRDATAYWRDALLSPDEAEHLANLLKRLAGEARGGG